jgi:glutamyl-tRNA synthetase
LTSHAEYKATVKGLLAQRGLDATDAELDRTIPLIREKARTYVDAAESLDFFFRAELVFDDKAVAKFLVPAHAANLADAARLVEGVGEWTVAAIEGVFDAWLAEKGLQIKDVAQPARVALSGRTVSPGIYETLHALGREVSVQRLRAGAARAAGAT